MPLSPGWCPCSMMNRLGRNAVPPVPCQDQLVHLPTADDEIGGGQSKRRVDMMLLHRGSIELQPQPGLTAQRFEHRASGVGQLRHPLLHLRCPPLPGVLGLQRRCESPPAFAHRRSTSCPCVPVPARSRRSPSLACASPDRACRRARPSSPGFSSGQTSRSALLSPLGRPARVPARVKHFGPFGARLEPDRRLGHGERRRIRGRVGASHLAERFGHLRELRERLVHSG